MVCYFLLIAEFSESLSLSAFIDYNADSISVDFHIHPGLLSPLSAGMYVRKYLCSFVTASWWLERNCSLLYRYVFVKNSCHHFPVISREVSLAGREVIYDV